MGIVLRPLFGAVCPTLCDSPLEPGNRLCIDMKIGRLEAMTSPASGFLNY